MVKSFFSFLNPSQSHNNPLNYEGVVCSGALSAPIAFDTYFSTEGGLMDQLLESSSNIVGGNSSSLVDGNHHHHQAFSVSSSTFNQNRKLGDLNSSSSSSSSFSSDGHGGRPGGKHSGFLSKPKEPRTRRLFRRRGQRLLLVDRSVGQLVGGAQSGHRHWRLSARSQSACFCGHLLQKRQKPPGDQAGE